MTMGVSMGVSIKKTFIAFSTAYPIPIKKGKNGYVL